MKKYEMTKQQGNLCIPAVIQAVLRKHHIELMQERIAKQLVRRKKGLMFDESLRRIFDKYNLLYQYFNFNETPFNEPDFLLQENQDKDIMIGYDKGQGLHIQLLIYFQYPKIILLDPADCRQHEENFQNILRTMFDTKKGGFGLVGKL